MNYLELDFVIDPFSTAAADILVARLSELSFESFEETKKGIKAYILSKEFRESDIQVILDQWSTSLGNLQYTYNNIQQENWNEEWEKNFNPITIADQCLIKAPFHENVPELKYNIVIQPKMAFGTGHHATTAMMIEHMLNVDMEEKKILDIGSGTGILSILASLMKADLVYAVDNDDWAYQNCMENLELNQMENIIPVQGDVNSVKDKFFDVILANINRNSLINDMESYANVLKSPGFLIMSGFYVDDITAIEQKANAQDLFLKKYLEKDNWASVIFAEK